ncbi:hypothetical protein B0A58_00500 [Flavobacterium branchiophilum NBRC 15030 = ATCC 35035]|uniref:DUF4254 domain-containing protein n=3 Tax=Flavobacterium branchiophilum TaxID=55197 RepID=G2Z4D2_FLABF|nr:DUF4254 domain-containing protein [Flavobacterium branchiophilum]OXA82198.1 hypothetical protein B0A58_00500 [Flavobacterium branchiophilum NBRC 15030 = ATCC 35035]PDS24710.1 DUF4254 domain-containing protein [Flavobacterium branchiophilum]GEM55419.1 hypothetical protein FB1_16400 [Flavobacterium branchiophilum NBRC 15030 = ATCC 35035]CCB68407.1 Protein of unknown function [Flavobacterium branchiophilum FL-15]
MFSKLAYSIFEQSIADYHQFDNVDQPIQNPYSKNDFEHLLYHKNWIDTVQWHFEDIIRDPNIDPVAALTLKRRIDASNQERTDMVEYIDSYFLKKYQHVAVKNNAKINSESPAWAFDRLSILALKIYHMKEEVNRPNATSDHKDKCQAKLNILLEQRTDLSLAIDDLLQDIEHGDKFMKVYKQMKMYNDEELNPILYQNK